MSNAAKYRDMTELHRRLPVFYQPWWLDTVCRDWDVILLEDDETLGVWPFQKEKKLSLLLIRPPLLTPYLQPLLIRRHGQDAGVLDDPAKYGKMHSLLPKYDFLQFQTIPGRDVTFPGQPRGANISKRITYYVYLQEEPEVIFSRIHEKRRNDIRKAERDLVVERAGMPVEAFNALHIQTFSRKGEQYRYPAGFIERLVAAADRNNASVCLTARDRSGNIQAILWAVCDRETMYYLLSTTSAQNKHRGAVSLLIWQAICYARESGLKVFDFEGSMNPGIESFFKRFGGERRTYLSFEHNRSFVWKIKKSLFP